MSSIIFKPLVQVVAEDFKGNRKLVDGLAKTRKVLEDYGKKIKMPLEKLRAVDIFNENSTSDISIHLTKFVDGLNKDAIYKRSAKSRLRSILKAVNALLSGKTGNADETIIPEFLKPVLSFLPRGEVGNHHASQSERLKFPLTNYGQKLLATILFIVAKYKIEDLESLFIKYRRQIFKKFKEDYPEVKENKNLRKYFASFAVRAGYRMSDYKTKKSVSLEDFPPKLKQQISFFLDKAPVGLDSEPELIFQASLKDITISPLESNTIKSRFRIIALALGQIEFEDYENVSVESFLRIETETRYTGDGEEFVFLFNPYVEQYREIERSKDSKYRRKGFDSTAFKHFLDAIKSVAIYNGIFQHNELFNKAYQARLDKKALKDRKKKKKVVFDRKWLDSEILRLSPRFRKIAKERLFVDDRKKRPFAESKENIDFCLFFVQLVTLRFMGFRQQFIRNCEVGRNIKISKDGTISFYWEAWEVKTDISFEAVLIPGQHGRTHGLLMETLNTYYQRIYPYICANAYADLEKQFFVKTRFSKFNRFRSDGSSNYAEGFKLACSKFLEYGDRLDEYPDGMHAHILRGVCGDWLVDDLDLTRAEGARFIGDTEKTFEQEYLDPTLGYNTRDPLNKSNENLRLREESEARANETNPKSPINSEKDKEIERLKETNALLLSMIKKQQNPNDFGTKG